MSKTEGSTWCAIHRAWAADCKQCEDEPYITRYFAGAVSIKDNALTENEPTEADWKEFEKELIKAMHQSHSNPYQIYFEEWDPDKIILSGDE